MPAPIIDRLDHLVLTVADLDATVGFYRDALGMAPERFGAADGTQRWALVFGHQKINLHPAEAPFEPKAHDARPGTADLCFLTKTDLETWIAHLKEHEVDIIEGPVPRTGATGKINSIYLRDPDGNLIEISTRV
ncbi:VOC family protein [Chachezhania antarctica]|uniref:VOC family protein n=1 Tax=Chachezhania antarctica TaxID=2340860 RepID=UPI000EAD46E9|nr:VOC family protein [Chachezhania antarctica]|tara:strand:- start:3440 stop:3841 length:402 start_codon:yes stop_codon:yes gene_type:complete